MAFWDIAPPILYFIGCFFLVPGSIVFFFSALNETSTTFFVCGCFLLFVAGFLDLFPLCKCCRRKHGEIDRLIQNSGVGNPSTATVFIVLFFFLGGLLFFVGSLLFYKSLNAGNGGIWVFRSGSVAYLVGNIVYWTTKPQTNLTFWGSVVYAVGSCLYIAGGILDEVNVGGFATAICWLLGSVAFFVGGSLQLQEKMGIW